MEQVKIIEYSDELADDFARLNKAWLQKYFVIEPIDHEMLSDPKRYFIQRNGFLFFAKTGNIIAGTFALLRESDDIYELSKMAVDEGFQGKKIGNLMLEFAIEKAKKLGAKKLILYSNTKLKPAIHLYRKFGFTEIPLDHSDYERADIKMEINLQS